MNYHYIEYMTKERHREEVEECKKTRLLKNIECEGTVLNLGLMKRMKSAISIKKQFNRAQPGMPGTNFLKIFFFKIYAATVKGRSI